MSRWIENDPGLKETLREAGRIGNGRFEGPPTTDNEPAEAVSLTPPYPAYWRQVMTNVIYDAIHHPPGGPKNVPSGQIAEAVVARLFAAERAATASALQAESGGLDVEALIADMPVAVLATDGGPAVAYAMRVEAYLRSSLATPQPGEDG